VDYRCDYHPSVQQIAFVNTDAGECGERRLNHSDGEAEKFYRELKAAGCCWRIAFRGCGYPVRKIEICVSWMTVSGSAAGASRQAMSG
jgi:hypothetical protein